MLNGPENDRTLGMRNVIALASARAMDRYASRTQFTELFLVQVGLGRCNARVLYCIPC